ncbi:SHOCT domain-containing protein [Streptosporangium carneum]|uniref:SHOCT domain-containing protein n=1 Tax=Streptosporangium carneum TaxID=47481 RepID=UPI0022F2DF91|nr:SHOCT domain-containing protein [Streptosporangium carneum]
MVVLLIIAVVVVVVLRPDPIMRVLKGNRRPALDDPREILKRRYAAGEIDEDEYLRRMSGLSQDW